jgi:hypothetical protein
MELNEDEKKILSIMFNFMYNLLNEMNTYDSFDENALNELAKKLGIDYYFI